MENGKKIGIYIHIPFCKQRCHYCTFVSCTHAELAEGYFAALIKEITLNAGKFNGYAVESVYFGGGTPSYADESYISRTLKALRENYNIQKNAEITIEANPESVTKGKIESYLKSGINRFSIGGQSFNDNILKAIGRVHRAADIKTCVNLLKSCGAESINCDIMLGLPYQDLNDVKNTVGELIGLDIPHISAYGLKLEEGAPLNNLKDAVADDDACADMYDYVCEELKKHGILRYEISNFAKPAFECRHNINYWRAGRYRGFGAAAHSYIDNIRFYNTEDIKKYINGKTIEGESKLSAQESEFEYIMLNLRLERGFSLNEYKMLFGADFLTKYKRQLDKFKDFFIGEGGNIRLSGNAFYVFNAIICEFIT